MYGLKLFKETGASSSSAFDAGNRLLAEELVAVNTSLYNVFVDQPGFGVHEISKSVQTDLSGMNIDDLQSKLDSQTREMKVTLSAIEKLYTKNQIAKLSLAMS
uniref:Uncharacterized protein LOC114324573 isoform X1 n=1 Tax=Diabrotica virgifera virgifera TaxID=50390 RepID=A0A6P7EYC6_DIAVI